MDIIKQTQRVSRFLKIEVIVLVVSFIACALLYALVVEPSKGVESLGALALWAIFCGICSVILFVLAFIFTIRTVSIKREVNNFQKQNSSLTPESFNNFKRRTRIVLILNAFFMAPAIALSVSRIIFSIISFVLIPNKQVHLAERAKIESQQQLEREPKLINWRLRVFQDSVSAYQHYTFIGYGAVTNQGNCINPPYGTIFNMGSNFKPKKIINPASFDTIKNGTIEHNEWIEGSRNLDNARCFSDQDHFAYQLPSFSEKEYPKFYCVDDVHAEIQISNKQIKGTNCDDLDLSYLPPVQKPIPDTTYYKYNL